MKVTAIIPARGGSKGVPGKNLQPIGGVSLIARAVNAAKRSDFVNAVYVSTDDAMIATEAKRAGGEIIERPAAIAGDTASSEAALLHALDELEKQDKAPEILVFLQCTSPFTTAADIDGVVRKLIDSNADAAFSMAPSHHFLWRDANSDGEVDPFGHEKDHRPRRQDRTPQYAETGAIYVMRAEGFKKAKHRFFGKTVGYITDEINLLEIDASLDLELCRRAAAFMDQRSLSEHLPDKIEAVLFDFDGVMTDDHVYIDETGCESVRAHRGDGLGIELLRQTGVKIGVISKEKNIVVSKRCAKLKIECIQGVDRKDAVIKNWADANRVTLKNIVYVGNDINDLPVIGLAGCVFSPADAHEAFRSAATAVLTKSGGAGAVREVCDLVCSAIARPEGA